MIQQTSLMAFKEVKQELGERQRQVLSLFANAVVLSDQDIAYSLRLPINSITPRRNELEKLNLIIYCGTKKSTYTGKSVRIYKKIGDVE